MSEKTRVLAGAEGVDEDLRDLADGDDAAVLDENSPDLLVVAVQDDAGYLQHVDEFEVVGGGALAVFAGVALGEHVTEAGCRRAEDQAAEQQAQPKAIALVETALLADIPGSVWIIRHA